MGRVKNQRIKKIIFHPLNSKEPIIYTLSDEGKLEKKMKRAVRTNYRSIEKQKIAKNLKENVYNDCDKIELPIFNSSSNSLQEEKPNDFIKELLCIGGIFKMQIKDDESENNQYVNYGITSNLPH